MPSESPRFVRCRRRLSPSLPAIPAPMPTLSRPTLTRDPTGEKLLVITEALLRMGFRPILDLQCFDWNAKPLRGSGAFRKQRNMQWRMISQHGVQFYVVGGVGTRDVERRFGRRMRLKGQ